MVVTSVAGMLAFAFMLLAMMSLSTIDSDESEEINNAGRRRWPGNSFFAQLLRFIYLKDEVSSTARMRDHWRARPQIRTFLALAVGFLIIALVCGHFATFP